MKGPLRFFLEQKLLVGLLVVFLFGWGLAVAPFSWDLPWLPRDPVPVDAIPDLGENQQIVFTAWPGHSPRDVEDQVTYPLTVSLLGVPGVKEVRSVSMFGFSSVFVIFEETIEFYWARSRILERLNSLDPATLPEGVRPALGPDATGLGQIFWYTLEGRDPDGKPVGGWDLQELRSIQDWYVRFGLQAAGGISEVASIGGFVSEYQVDVDPNRLRIHGVTLEQVVAAVRESNLEVGARTTEINRVEYFVRGTGFVRDLRALEEAVVRLGPGNTPVRVADVATVTRGPGERRGALTLGGAEAVGGVVVVREGYNPREALANVHAKIEELGPGMPARAVILWELTDIETVYAFAERQGLTPPTADGLAGDASWVRWLRTESRAAWPPWLTLSTLTIEPFYDRTQLIDETLATLNDALIQQMLVTLIVVVFLLLHLRSALLVSALLPLSVLAAFILMKLFGVDANVVALAGIAIAIGTIVDMGIILTENVMRNLREASPEESTLEVIYRGCSEVSSAILTAISTTVISFLPVFTMTGAEGKLFVPLAFTKTFVLLASIVITLVVLPAAIHLISGRRGGSPRGGAAAPTILGLLGAAGFAVGVNQGWGLLWQLSLAAFLVALAQLSRPLWPSRVREWQASLWERARRWHRIPAMITGLVICWVLAGIWEPLGPERGPVLNVIFILFLIGGLLLGFVLFARFYGRLLGLALEHRIIYLMIPLAVVVLGALSWMGFERVLRPLPAAVSLLGGKEAWLTGTRAWAAAANAFPGLGREFMPTLDEGAFLWMPTTMPHASLGEALEVLQYQDQAIAGVPEVEVVAGKIGRAETALDPAPVSMIETIIFYKPEYRLDASGRRLNFRFDRARGEFVRDEAGELIPDPGGIPYRQWRDHIRKPADIWDEIVAAAELPGTTSAPLLQPIETRLVMLQTGMRAPMGLKVRGPDLETLDGIAVALEQHLRDVPEVAPATVNADRVVGKPYLEIVPDREAIGRFGLSLVDVQNVITTAIGGRVVGATVEGRERYPIRVRYPRELRQSVEAMEAVLLDLPGGGHVPLREVAEIQYVRGPQMIRSEDTFLTAYVTFGGAPGIAEVEVVEAARNFLNERIESGALEIPPGVSWRFAGSYENQVRATRTLAVVLPVALAIIFVILYLQFRAVSIGLIVASSIFVAWGGGFLMLHAYSLPWFLDFSIFGVNLRELFQLQTVNLSVAVWVGFLALFGIAVDDGVVMATYLRQQYRAVSAQSVAEIRRATIEAGTRRLRPCLMTSATTLLALLPVLTSTGRGSELMIPMALPSVGGVLFVLLALITVPVLYSWKEERALRKSEI